MHKKDWALNDLQWLICHKTKPISKKKELVTYWILLFQRITELNERSQIDRQIISSCQRDEKAVEHESGSDTNNTQHTGISRQGLGKETGV